MGKVRKAVGQGVDLMLDMGFPVPLDDAIRPGRMLAEHDVFFLEEPLTPEDLHGWAKLTAASPTPIATGEKETGLHPYLNLMEHGRLRMCPTSRASASSSTSVRSRNTGGRGRWALMSVPWNHKYTSH